MLIGRFHIIVVALLSVIWLAVGFVAGVSYMTACDRKQSPNIDSFLPIVFINESEDYVKIRDSIASIVFVNDNWSDVSILASQDFFRGVSYCH
jgi:hypothetical protein